MEYFLVYLPRSANVAADLVEESMIRRWLKNMKGEMGAREEMFLVWGKQVRTEYRCQSVTLELYLSG